jgi:hypothetical protein
MWIALATAITLPLVVSMLLFRVRLRGDLNLSDLPCIDL